ncbi:MAG: hypothetical protein KC621_11900 [Myxococcales bacterium]|nr:hypothetical protein [Myxococcales bacterium]MCB9597415.1 hypothetical protein [Sandaracinaceae bacterium]
MTLVRSGWAWVAVLGLAAGCNPPEVSCGAGTVLMGDQCVASNPDSMGMMMDPPPSGSDAGTSTMDPPPPPPPPPGTDGGPGWSTTDPMAPPIEPGCDMATGECEAWADTLVELLAAHPGRGCSEAVTRPEGLQAVAERHALHQADIDMLDSTSPDGDLFRQVRDAGVHFMNAGALFSVGNQGAADVMGRWADRGATSMVLDQCWTMAGVSFATGESGWSYATVLLAR